MTYEEWAEKYRPIDNPLNSSRGYDGKMFETFDEELDMVKATPNPQTIWTLLTEGDHTWIAAGWHFVNRMGYFVTEVPFTDEEQNLEIMIDQPRFQAQLNQGFGYAVVDVEHDQAVCWVDLGRINGMEIAETIASALVAYDREEDIALDYSHEDDEEDESVCLTEGCTDDANDGEGFDGYCGNCADRREANNEGIES